MASIQGGGSEAVYNINKWLGINENPDGDTGLKMGEAASMRNFRITADGHLQKRPGYKTVADLGGKCLGLWHGRVGERDCTLAAAGGKVYSLDLEAGTKAELGEVAAGERVSFFGYGGKVYIMDGAEYRVYDGASYEPVQGYVPCLYTASHPSGGGTAFEQVNKLTTKKCIEFSADGTATEYRLVEPFIASVDRVTVGGEEKTEGYTVDLDAGTVTFTEAPAEGINNVKIWWTGSYSHREQVTSMRYMEQYNGTTDSRVFLYGDGGNKLLYSGLDRNGQPTAEYFPDMNAMAVGESNTPVTGAIRQYSRLIVFKSTSTYSVAYDSITLADGSITAGFYVTPVNRSIGNAAPGQVRLVTNYPRTLHGGGVYEWKNGSYGLSSDERQAKRISKRVESSLAGFDFASCITFENEFAQDYYIVHNGTAVIHNYAEDAWFLYTDFPATAFVMVGNDMYIGTAGGKLCRVSREYKSDDGEKIFCYWESGAMSFGRDFEYKHSSMIWISIEPESNAEIAVTIQTDRKSSYVEKFAVSSLAAFSPANFGRWSFNTNRKPRMTRLKIKAKKFVFYKLIFTTDTSDTTATILSADMRIRFTGYAK